MPIYRLAINAIGSFLKIDVFTRPGPKAALAVVRPGVILCLRLASFLQTPNSEAP